MEVTKVDKAGDLRPLLRPLAATITLDIVTAFQFETLLGEVL